MLAHLAYVEAAEGCTPKCDDASRRVQVERENSEQGGLAATIRSEHDPALTVVEVKAQVIDDAAPIMNDGRMSQAKHRVGGGVRRHWVDGSRSGRRSWQSVSMSNARDDLENGLARVLGVNAVVDLTRLTSGASRETWSFVADGEKYILQRERSGGVGRLRHEPALLRAAASAAVPVPEVVVDGSESDALERPFMIVRFIEGETIARRILRDDSFSNTRSAFVREVAMAMARLHSLPVDVVPGLDASDQLRMYDKLLCDLGQPHPAFELVLRWLNDNKPLTSRRTIVHGDLRLGNVLVDGQGVRAVLDWELAHVGDPMEDLGWLCVRAWRFGSKKPVAGVGEYEELFDAYEQASGVRPDPEVVRWWEVFGTLRWGVICIMQMTAHMSGMSRSHELAAIGRRVCETEYDAFKLLEGRW